MVVIITLVIGNVLKILITHLMKGDSFCQVIPFTLIKLFSPMIKKDLTVGTISIRHGIY